MAEPVLNPPEGGAKITIQNGVLSVPDNPIIPFIEGDGIGPDIWAAARRVLDAIDSPNLQVALDPVNLLAKENMDRKDQVMDEALDLLMPDIAMLHIKDYLVEGVPRAVAAGEGLMDFRHIFERLAPKKPFIHIALENTTAENAARALQHVRTQWQEAGGQQVDA